MRKTWQRFALALEPGSAACAAALIAILFGVAMVSVIHAISRPFWYDELCTLTVCRLAGASEMWKALDNAVDTNPPLFYFFTRWAAALVADEHVGYRLLSISGLLGTIALLYRILSAHVRPLAALLGATFVLTTRLGEFGYEARPYAAVTACIAVAILAWQSLDRSRAWAVGLAVALAVAVSLHYYAILLWPSFLLAELFIWISRREFRAGAWGAFAVALAPLAATSGLLSKIREYYGEHFWAEANVRQIGVAHDWLLNVEGRQGLAASCVLTLVVVLWWWRKPAGFRASGLLGLLLLWMPAVAVTAAILTHGGMTYRYMLPTVLGGGLLLGLVGEKLPGVLKILAIASFLWIYVSQSSELVKRAFRGQLDSPTVAATREVKPLVDQHRNLGLPVVISSGVHYMEINAYAEPDFARQLYALTDPAASVKFIATDSVDRGLLKLKQYTSVQVEDYDGFVARHPQFLYIAEDGRGLDWLAVRLARERRILERLSKVGKCTIYRVTVRS